MFVCILYSVCNAHAIIYKLFLKFCWCLLLYESVKTKIYCLQIIHHIFLMMMNHHREHQIHRRGVFFSFDVDRRVATNYWCHRKIRRDHCHQMVNCHQYMGAKIIIIVIIIQIQIIREILNRCCGQRAKTIQRVFIPRWDNIYFIILLRLI